MDKWVGWIVGSAALGAMSCNRTPSESQSSPPRPTTSASSSSRPATSGTMAPLPAAAAAMSRVPGGRHVMGRKTSPHPIDGLPRREVDLSPFDLDVSEVTVDAYRACVAARSCTKTGLDEAGCNWCDPQRAKHPINCVNFEQASSYCSWVGKRLPTDDEWEVALREDLLRVRDLSGFDLERACMTGESTAGCLAPHKDRAAGTCMPGSYALPESRLGIKDLIGNVSEWTTGRYCSWRERWCSAHVIRGTGWCANVYDELWQRRVGIEAAAPPAITAPKSVVGFRCARSAT